MLPSLTTFCTSAAYPDPRPDAATVSTPRMFPPLNYIPHNGRPRGECGHVIAVEDLIAYKGDINSICYLTFTTDLATDHSEQIVVPNSAPSQDRATFLEDNRKLVQELATLLQD